MKEVIVFGTGMIGEVIHYYMESESDLQLTAFTCDKDFITDKEFKGRPVMPFEDIENQCPPSRYTMFIGLGYQELNKIRTDRLKQAREKGYEMVSYIHPNSGTPKDVQVGENCFIMNNVSIQPKVIMGDNVFVWSGAIIGHHSEVGDNTWLTSGSQIMGSSKVGKSCFIGSGAVVGNNVIVGDNCFIGANTLVTKDMEDSAVVIEQSTAKFRLNSEEFLKISKFR